MRLASAPLRSSGSSATERMADPGQFPVRVTAYACRSPEPQQSRNGRQGKRLPLLALRVAISLFAHGFEQLPSACVVGGQLHSLLQLFLCRIQFPVICQ